MNPYPNHGRRRLGEQSRRANWNRRGQFGNDKGSGIKGGIEGRLEGGLEVGEKASEVHGSGS